MLHGPMEFWGISMLNSLQLCVYVGGGGGGGGNLGVQEGRKREGGVVLLQYIPCTVVEQKR